MEVNISIQAIQMSHFASSLLTLIKRRHTVGLNIKFDMF